MRTLSCAVLLALSATACSSEISPVVGSASPAAQPPKPVVTPTPPQPPSSLSRSRVTLQPNARAGAVPVRLTVPTHTEGAVVSSNLYGSAEDDIATAVARDASSNIVTAGRLGGSGDIGCGQHTSATGAGYVAQTNAAGACTWAVYFNDDGFVSPSAVTVAADGSVYVAGSFDATAVFGAAQYVSAGGLDGFLVKIAAGGTVAWARTFGGADDEYPYAVAVSGNSVAVGGAFYGTMAPGGDGTTTLTSNGDADAFLATFAASDGGLVTSRAFGGPGWDAVNALTFNEGAQVIAVGTHAGGLDLGLGTIATAGGQDGFVAVYNGSLGAVAARSFGGTGDDAAHGVVVDATSRIIVAGYFVTAADVGAVSPLAGTGSYTAFWARYGGSLAFDTAATLASDGGIIAETLALQPTGDIVIGGQFTGTTTPGAFQMSAGAARAGFAASFSPSGSPLWATSVHGSGDTEILGMVGSASGTVAVGSSWGSLDSCTTPNAGGSDVAVMTLGN